jgi:hypothetical protein
MCHLPICLTHEPAFSSPQSVRYRAPARPGAVAHVSAEAYIRDNDRWDLIMGRYERMMARVKGKQAPAED